MQNKLLALIIPCYGKENDIVKRTIDSAVLNFNHKVEIVFVYKNSEKFNYDWVLDYIDSNKVKVIKIEQGQKQAKIKTALHYITAKYTIALDADDLIEKDNFDNVLSFLDSNENDLINMKVKVYDDKLNFIKESIPFDYKKHKVTTFKKKYVYFGNTSLLFKTEFLKSIIDLTHDEILLGEDAERILISLTKTTKIDTLNINLIKYIKYEDSESSSNANKKKSSFDSVYKLINIYGKLSIQNIDTKNRKLFEIIIYPYFFALLNYWRNTKDLDAYKKSLSLLKEIKNLNNISYLSMLLIYKATRFTLYFKKV